MFANMKYSLLWKIAALVVSNACLTPAVAAPTKPASGKAYTVKSGDTFAKIARTNGISLNELLKSNKVSDPNQIKLGQRIVIPGKATPGTAKTPKKPRPVKETAQAPAKKLPAKAPSPVQSTRQREELVKTTVNLTPPSPAGSYVVQSGDTLNRVHRRTGVPVATLCRNNGLTETSVLRPGEKLALGTAVAGQKAPAKPQPAPIHVIASPYAEPAAPVIHEPAAPRTKARPALHEQPSSSAPATITTTAPHKVESGETFTSIGRLYGLKQSQLLAANPGVNPAKLRIGQPLLIPGQPARPQAQPLVVRADGRILAPESNALGNLAPVSAAPVERTRTGYLVEEGETLTQIARRFHTSEQELRRLNRFGDSDNIYAGRYILVPFIRQAPAEPALASHDS